MTKLDKLLARHAVVAKAIDAGDIPDDAMDALVDEEGTLERKIFAAQSNTPEQAAGKAEIIARAARQLSGNFVPRLAEYTAAMAADFARFDRLGHEAIERMLG